MRRLAALAVAGLVTLAGASSASAKPVPRDSVIVIPGIAATEGIAAGRGSTFYVGDRIRGDVYRGDIRTGRVTFFVDAPGGRMATGMKVDRSGRLLFVSGAATGQGYVYDARTGAEIAVFQLTDPAAGTFINDVAVTRDAAWFTDSRQPVLYKVPIGRRGTVGPVETLHLSGPAADTSSQFNLNGIAAANSDRALLVAHSGKGTIIRVDPVTGASVTVAGVSVPNVDGILYERGRLWAVQNQRNQIARINLDRHLTSGRVERVITSEHFQIPTTIAFVGSRLAAVNAKFGVPNPTQFEVVVLGAV
jgi:sugar lactone lactonase YvrE